MMVPVADEEDDFIVQSAALVEEATAGTQQEDVVGWRQYGLQKLGGLVFAKGAETVVESEPTLPTGFSATLNAEEEEIYPAEAKMKVLFAEESLSGRNRREAAELHQALQQVVGVAAIYSHFLAKHGGVGTRRKRDISDKSPDGDAAAAASKKHNASCVCGGTTGSCKAISSLLDGEMRKVVAGAETDRRGAMLKKLQQVERRSGGLCSPELIKRVVRSSSTGGRATPPSLLSAPASPSSVLSSPRHLDSRGLAPAATAGSNLVVDVDVDVDGGDGVGDSGQDIPWAEDLLSLAVRKRNAVLLKTRGRALAKGLARMLKGVSKELKGVASRLPPWEEEDEEPPPVREEMASLSRIQSRSNVFGHPTHDRTESRGSFSSAVDVSEDNSEKAPSPGDNGGVKSGGAAADLGASGRPPMSSNGAVSAVAAVAAAAAAIVVSPVAAVASFAAGPASPPAVAKSAGPAAGSKSVAPVGGKGRRRDWKLSAQELSLIRKEEERVMKPDILARLLAKGASLGCLQQADFWDVFARLEVATRTEALLNLAIKGGRGCPERSGRMGRELYISLTSVVLEAINIVKRSQLDSRQSSPVNSSRQQPPPPPTPPRQQQQLDERSNGASLAHKPQQGGRPAPFNRQRSSSEVLSVGSPTAPAGAAGNDSGDGGGGRARAGSFGLPPVRRVVKGESVAGPASVSKPFYKEDSGLKDLDNREEEFRRAIYVDRKALATRLMRLINDAPLCKKILGTFVDNTAKNASLVEGTQARPQSVGTGAAADLDSRKNPTSSSASSPGASSTETAAAMELKPPVSAGDGGTDGLQAAPPVDLLTGDTTTTPTTTPTAAAAGTHTTTTTTTTTSKESIDVDGSCGESHASQSVSLSGSSSTDPMSDGAEDCDSAVAAASLSSLSSPPSETQKQLTPPAAPVEEATAVSEPNQASEDPIEVEPILV